jgi:biopolymer transport protein ExbD
MEDLPVKLKEKVKGNLEERIYLRADQNLMYRKVMDVMNLMQDSGFFKVGLVAEEVLVKAEAGS